MLLEDVEYLDVLSSSTSQQSLQRESLSAQLELLLIRVSLYLALAGDFAPHSQDLLDWQAWSCPPILQPIEGESGMLDSQEFPTPEATSETEDPQGQDANAEEIPLPPDGPDQEKPSEEMELTQPESELDLGQFKVHGSFPRDRC